MSPQGSSGVATAWLGPPVDARRMFRPELAALLELLRDLRPAEWNATAVPDWSVRDLAAHLLGDYHGRLGRAPGGRPPAFAPGESLEAFVHRVNQQWVDLYTGRGPAALVEAVEEAGTRLNRRFEAANLAEPQPHRDPAGRLDRLLRPPAAARGDRDGRRRAGRQRVLRGLRQLGRPAARVGGHAAAPGPGDLRLRTGTRPGAAVERVRRPGPVQRGREQRHRADQGHRPQRSGVRRLGLLLPHPGPGGDRPVPGGRGRPPRSSSTPVTPEAPP